MAWSKLIDLAMTPEERLETGMVFPGSSGDQPTYPFGTRISLCEKELDKLGLDIKDADIGDLVDMRCFGVITSTSETDGPDGPCQRVEIQIEKMAIESELAESMDEED